MPYIERSITAGKVKEVTKYHTVKYQSKKKSRRKNANKTNETQARANERRSEEKLRMLLNANFTANDFYITLTYAGEEPTDEEAKEHLAKFLRKLRNHYKRDGATLKYITITEHGRVHHHMVVNRVEAIGKDDIKKLWTLGFNKVELFGGQPEDCAKVAKYFTKQHKMRRYDKKARQGVGWKPSKNLIRPEPEIKVVSADSWRETPKPPQGYYIDVVEQGATQDGYPYQFCRMIKIDAYTKKCKVGGE